MTRDDGACSTRERAFAVAAVRALGARAEAVCGRRSAALKRLAALWAADPKLLGREAERLDRPVPDGIEEVHRSWFEAPPPSERPAARAWLGRRAHCHLVEMTQADAGQPLDRLAALDPDALVRLLRALGLRRVAIAFSGAPRAALARLCARLGEPAAGELIAQVRALGSRLRSEEVRAAQRALFQLGVDARREPQSDEVARELFLRAGAGWLGPALEARGGDRLRRVAQRLPRPVGARLLEGARAPSTEAEQADAAHAALLLASPPPRA